MPRAISSFLLTFALAAPLACTGRTAPLDSLQSNPGRDGGPTDGMVLDSAVVDAGTLDAGDPGPVDAGPGGACAYAGPYQQTVQLGQDTGLPFFVYSGAATLLSRNPLDVELRGGGVVRISLGDAPLPADLTPGRAIWLQYGTDTPQWTNTAVAILEIAPNDGPGRLRILAWAYGEEELDFEDFEELQDFELFYETDDCTPFSIACGPARTESFVVKGPGVESRVGAGSVQSFRTIEVGNGQSHRYAPFPECTDTPSFWHEGYIAVF